VTPKNFPPDLIDLLCRLRLADVRLILDGDRIHFRAPRHINQTLLDEARWQKAGLLTLLRFEDDMWARQGRPPHWRGGADKMPGKYDYCLKCGGTDFWAAPIKGPKSGWCCGICHPRTPVVHQR
jgi:hypothetical protein